jgi:hypothetical protein
VDSVRQALDGLPARPDLAVLYLDPRDEPQPSLRLMLVSERLDRGMVQHAIETLELGREIHPWLLDRRRYRDLAARDDVRLRSVLDGSKVVLSGNIDPSGWA